MTGRERRGKWVVGVVGVESVWCKDVRLLGLSLPLNSCFHRITLEYTVSAKGLVNLLKLHFNMNNYNQSTHYPYTQPRAIGSQCFYYSYKLSVILYS